VSKFTQSFRDGTGLLKLSIRFHHGHVSNQPSVRIITGAVAGDIKLTYQTIGVVQSCSRMPGYDTVIKRWPINGRLGKTDYNFQWDSSVYEFQRLAGRKEGTFLLPRSKLPGQVCVAKTQSGWNKIGRRAETGIRRPHTLPGLSSCPPYYPIIRIVP